MQLAKFRTEAPAFPRGPASRPEGVPTPDNSGFPRTCRERDFRDLEWQGNGSRRRTDPEGAVPSILAVPVWKVAFGIESRPVAGQETEFKEAGHYRIAALSFRRRRARGPEMREIHIVAISTSNPWDGRPYRIFPDNRNSKAASDALRA